MRCVHNFGLNYRGRKLLFYMGFKTGMCLFRRVEKWGIRWKQVNLKSIDIFFWHHSTEMWSCIIIYYVNEMARRKHIVCDWIHIVQKLLKSSVIHVHSKQFVENNSYIAVYG